MSYQDLRALLKRLFARLNDANGVPHPEDIWADYQRHINHLLSLNGITYKFTNLGNGIQLPKALEASRLLRNLHQR
ncbi:MAG: hypothetical protein F6K21_05110 [Symploca sp. SIO2D2]|nr:hypothetical protein [Symploca sp. SIO2D2]